jgi:hypothetical protein
VGKKGSEQVFKNLLALLANQIVRKTVKIKVVAKGDRIIQEAFLILFLMLNGLLWNILSMHERMSKC